ncbi:hypothetical protein HPB47_024454 [Ixodes persulcatus]|uniref:Uncharacterized protein n=1 Tax=Ixodes persulcatus TaxID=34615 RepID=A0AC60Q678_IXOPE|nr:hypothetical protein HPB47_024454 [Ixodes persulcatus]
MDTSGDPPPSYHLSAIHQLRLPKFWSSDPQVWFAQVESQFNISRITSQAQRFHYVVAALPPEISMEILDIILDPPAASPYDVLKTELVKRTSESEQRPSCFYFVTGSRNPRCRVPLQPSQLLRRLQQLLGEKARNFDVALLRELFLQQLPVNVRMVLASASGLALPELSQLISALTDHRPSILERAVSTNTCTLDDIREEFRHEMRDLSAQVAAIATRSTSRANQGFSQRSCHKSPNTSLCWYHRTFGDLARNCVSPCSASGNPLIHH